MLPLLESLGFMDDVMVMATGKDFDETTDKIRRSMEDKNGGLQWSRDHNSCFEISKLAIMHCGWKKKKQPNGTLTPLPCPALVLQGKPITKVNSYKYLGIYVDNKLS
jgi:hypothetical protein